MNGEVHLHGSVDLQIGTYTLFAGSATDILIGSLSRLYGGVYFCHIGRMGVFTYGPVEA
jgi:hypothetical protein